MVSNIRYYSFKDINLRKSVPFFVIAAIVLGFALVSISPEMTCSGSSSLRFVRLCAGRSRLYETQATVTVRS
jgi:phosphatidylserine synthase